MIKTVLAFIAALGTVLDLLKSLKAGIASILQKRREEKLKAGVDEAKKAKSEKEKQDAACKIEKVFNPDSDCDSEPRG